MRFHATERNTNSFALAVPINLLEEIVDVCERQVRDYTHLYCQNVINNEISFITNHVFSHPEGPLASQVSILQMRSKLSSLP